MVIRLYVAYPTVTPAPKSHNLAPLRQYARMDAPSQHLSNRYIDFVHKSRYRLVGGIGMRPLGEMAQFALVAGTPRVDLTI